MENSLLACEVQKISKGCVVPLAEAEGDQYCRCSGTNLENISRRENARILGLTESHGAKKDLDNYLLRNYQELQRTRKKCETPVRWSPQTNTRNLYMPQNPRGLGKTVVQTRSPTTECSYALVQQRRSSVARPLLPHT